MSASRVAREACIQHRFTKSTKIPILGISKGIGLELSYLTCRRVHELDVFSRRMHFNYSYWTRRAADTQKKQAWDEITDRPIKWTVNLKGNVKSHSRSSLPSSKSINLRYSTPLTTRSPAVARVGPTVLVVTDLEGHPKSMIFTSSKRAYATSY